MQLQMRDIELCRGIYWIKPVESTPAMEYLQISEEKKLLFLRRYVLLNHRGRSHNFYLVRCPTSDIQEQCTRLHR